jgi:DNA-binding SARP family transcriptional activator/tetratricopeptide (TPR) repeat protein
MIILHTLGTASIEVGARDSWVTPKSPRRFALLLYLAVERGRPVSRERLESLIFPGFKAVRAGHSLRQLVYELRALGVPLVSGFSDVTLPANDVACDFEAVIAAAKIDPKTLRAVAGGFLPGYDPDIGEEYREWFDAFRASTVGALTRRLVASVTAATHTAQWELADETARACLVLDAFNQEATFAVADLQAMSGSKATAFQTLDRYISELGPRSADLKSAALQLRRRIAEGLPVRYVDAVATSRSGSVRTVTPTLVGRATELTALQDALSRARAGDPQCVVVAGEAGIGKTRLVSEFAAAAAIGAAHIERVTIQPHDVERPMGAFVDMVPALLRAPGALGSSPESIEALTNLTQQPSDEPSEKRRAVDTEHHEARWTAIASAVVDLCEAIATEAPLILALDDVHWLDSSSMDVIARMVRGRRKTSILVVVTTREPREFMHRMRYTERCCLLQPTVLDSTTAASLLDEVLGKEQGAALASLKTRIAAACGGNPLFLISVAAHSRADGDELRIPATVIESFGQRIDALTRPSVSVLATCAEFGKHATLDRLSRALDVPRHTLVETLMELADAGLILQTEQSAIPAHPLVSEALTLRFPAPAKQAVSYTVAATLEADAAAALSPALWWDAAESWRSAGNAERAIHALRRCASHALDIGRPGEAARLLDHAATLPQSAESLGEVSEALIRAADSANEFALVISGARMLTSARPQRGHDECEIAELNAHFAMHSSDYDIANRLMRCIKSPDATPVHRVKAAIILLKAADMTGRADLREIAIDAASASDLATVDLLAKLEFDLLVASARGNRTEAANIARAILGCSQNADDQPGLPFKYHQTAATALYLGGNAQDAIAEYTRLFETGQRRGSHRGQLFAAVQLASLCWDRASEEEAIAWVARALALTDERPDLAVDFELATMRVEMALFHGRLQEAEDLVYNATATLPTNDIVRRWAGAASLAIRCGRGLASKADAIVARSIGRDRLRSMTGCRDFEVAVSVEALLRLGAARDAARVLSEYLNVERSDERPPTRLLLKAMAAAEMSPRLPHAAAAGRRHVHSQKAQAPPA